MSNTNKTTSNYEDKYKKNWNRENKAEKSWEEGDKEDKVSEIAVTEEIFKTEIDNKSNMKDIHKTNEKETAGRDGTNPVKENADTVSPKGAREEICNLLKQKMERKMMFWIKKRKLLWCPRYEGILRISPKKVKTKKHINQQKQKLIVKMHHQKMTKLKRYINMKTKKEKIVKTKLNCQVMY